MTVDDDLKELGDFIENSKDDLNAKSCNNNDNSIFNRDKFSFEYYIRKHSFQT